MLPGVTIFKEVIGDDVVERNKDGEDAQRVQDREKRAGKNPVLMFGSSLIFSGRYKICDARENRRNKNPYNR
jgi:hypothetical protein